MTFDPSILDYSKINIIGTSGSGKSTLGARLAKKRNADFVQLDQVFWKPNWTGASKEEFERDLTAKLSTESWVLDGNYDSRSKHIKWKDPVLVIWMDLPFLTTLWQVTKRTVRRAITREEIIEGTGCRESFWRSFFTKDSIILWTIQTHFQNREKYLKMIEENKTEEHLKFIRIRSHKEAEELLSFLTD